MSTLKDRKARLIARIYLTTPLYYVNLREPAEAQ
jgi:hypothetical protein